MKIFIHIIWFKISSFSSTMSILWQDVFFDLRVVEYSFMVQNTSQKSRIYWKNFQVVVLTLSSSKSNFLLHWKIEKSQKIWFFKTFILDEFFIGWILTIKNENFRCCGMFLNWNSAWYILRIHFLIKSMFDIFQFLNCGLRTLAAKIWFVRPDIGRSVIFSENIHL